MGSYEIIVKTEEIRRRVQDGDYDGAQKIVDTIPLKKVKNVADLSLFAEIYTRNERYDEAMELLYRVYKKSKTRRTLYQMVQVAIERKNIEEAERFLKEYKSIAPNDYNNYIFRYKIDKLKKEPYDVLIESLKNLKLHSYIEKWAYELAKLYYKAGMEKECIQECSDIILWFGEGSYVEKAKILKAYYSGEVDKDDILEKLKSRSKDSQTSSQQVVISEDESQNSYQEDLADGHDSQSWYQQDDMLEEDAQISYKQSILHEEESQSSYEQNIVHVEESQSTYQENIVFEDDSESSYEQNTVVEESTYQQDLLLDDESQNIYQQNLSLEENAQSLYQENRIPEEDSQNLDKQSIATEDDIKSFEEFSEKDNKKKAIRRKLRLSGDEDEAKIINELTDYFSKEVDKFLANKQSAEEKRELTESDVQNEINRILKPEGVNEELERLSSLSKEYNVDLYQIFGNFLHIKALQKQLVSSLELIMNKHTKSVQMIITGEPCCGKTTLAKDMAIFLKRTGKLQTSRIAKISAVKLNKIDLMSRKEELKNCCLVVENASDLKRPTIDKLLKLIEHFHGNIAVIFEENKKNMNRLFRECPKLMEIFNNRIHIPQYNEDDLLGFAYANIVLKGYKIEPTALYALKIGIYEIIYNEEKEKRLEKISEYIQNAMTSADIRTGKQLPMLAASGRLADVEILSLLPEDFTRQIRA